MNNNIAQIEGNYSLAKDDFTENELYNELKATLNINDDSFKLLSEKKNSFDNANKICRQKRSHEQYKISLINLLKGDKSNEKEWGELKEIKSNMKTYAKEMNELGNLHASVSTIFGCHQQ